MFVKNDTSRKSSLQRKIGVIDKINKDNVVVKCNGDENVLWLNLQNANIKYSINDATEEIQEELTFIQYP